jgi:hypothetical protein
MPSLRLPNKEKAYIPRHKILDYLLSEKHAVGKSKARFFRSLGFDESNAGELEQLYFPLTLRTPPYMVKKPKNRPCKPYMGLPYMARSGNFPVNRPYMGVGYKLAEPKEQGLLGIAQIEEIKESIASPHGTKYVLGSPNVPTNQTQEGQT